MAHDFVRKFLAKGRAESLLDVLEARGLRVSDEARARILACTDATQLDTWLRMAAAEGRCTSRSGAGSRGLPGVAPGRGAGDERPPDGRCERTSDDRAVSARGARLS